MTWNIDKRMDQHKAGKGSAFTARHGFKALRYVEQFTNIEEARLREHQLKDFSRKKKELLFERSENNDNASSRPSASNNNLDGQL